MRVGVVPQLSLDVLQVVNKISRYPYYLLLEFLPFFNRGF